MKTGFFKHSAPIFDGVFGVLDLLIVLISFLLCHYLYFWDLDVSSERLLIVIFTMGLTYAVFAASGVYKSKRVMSLHEEFGRLLFRWIIVILGVGLFAFLTKIAGTISRLWFGGSMVAALMGLAALRLCVRVVLGWLRSAGYNYRSVVLVGAGELGQLTIKRLSENPWAGLRVTAIFADEEEPIISSGEKKSSTQQLDGRTSELLPFVEKMRKAGTPVDQVWISLSMNDEDKTRSLMNELKDSSVDVCIVPSIFGMQLLSGSINHIADVSVINMSEAGMSSFDEMFKAVVDFVLACFAILLLSPLLLMISIAIKIDTRGSILFKQRRYGVDGKEIEVWKFRTMNVTEDGDTVQQATQGDQRVTKVGAFLRRTSLDELPQFFNVVQGKMSIVGPRPHAVSHNEEYRHKIDGYMMRHRIRPGITGWAQVNGWRGETDTLEKMEKRVHYDLEYIRNWSIWLDIKIILLTVIRGFTGKNVY